MTSSVLAQDAFAPKRLPGMRFGLALAIIVHVLLVLALAWSVNWRTKETEGIVAELWAATAQVAAPRARQRPCPAPSRRPRSRRREVKPAPPPPDVAAARAGRGTDRDRSGPLREKARREQKKSRLAAEEARKVAARRGRGPSSRKPSAGSRNANAEEAAAKEEARQKKLAEEQARKKELAAEQARKKELAEQAKRDEARLAATREANLKRMMGQAGAAGESTSTGTAARSAGPSAGYAGRIKARIKPNIVLTSPVDGNPIAEVEAEPGARRHHRRPQARQAQRLCRVGRDGAAGHRPHRGAAARRRRPGAAGDGDRVPAARIGAGRAACLLPASALPGVRMAPPSDKRWSQHVTETSDALDLKEGVFTQTDPKKIAASLKRSAEHSDRRKSDPYRSAMSMLTFYINRAGHGLPESQHRHLEAAKDELRRLFGKPPPRRKKSS